VGPILSHILVQQPQQYQHTRTEYMVSQQCTTLKAIAYKDYHICLRTQHPTKKFMFIYLFYLTTLSTVQVTYRRLIWRLINKEFEQKVEGNDL